MFLCSSCTKHSSALQQVSAIFFMMSKGKGQICSMGWMAILSSSPAFPLVQQIVVHLARAEEDLLNRGWVLAGGTIVQDHPLKLGAREQVVEGGLALGQPEQRFGSH